MQHLDTPEDADEEMLHMDGCDSRQESSSSSDSTTESPPSDSETSTSKQSRVEGESEDDTYAVSKSDGEEMIEQLVEKLKLMTNSERLSVLTVVPKSWSACKTAAVFGVSRKFAGWAKQLVEERGVLSSPDPKEAKAVTVAEEEVTKFYLSDDISRIMPGMKDYISARGTNEQRAHQQKRLLLCNLKEAYSEFK